MTNDYIVKPVYKALQVLQCLGEEQRELALSEICYRVGLPKTTVFRYLYTLRECGFVDHDPATDLYRLGLRMWELGRAAGAWLRIREVAVPFMRELRNRFNETVNLGMLDDTEVVYLEMVESRRSLRMHARLGGRDPVYSTALGKAMLAFLPEEQWRNHLPAQLVPRTSQTLRSFDSLKQELVQTGKYGFAQDHGENEEGACCVGAPIFDQFGRVVAAVSLSAPTSRLHGALEQEVATAVMQTATAVSLRLGYHSNGA
jgi:DNA-binding IclR family transcriptional regulator